jgi:hypothetical protein
MKSADLFGTVRTRVHLQRTLNGLVEGWCQRHCFEGLRLVLPVWPLVSPLTDGWGELLRALRQVELLPGGTLTADEQQAVHDANRFIEQVVLDR